MPTRLMRRGMTARIGPGWDINNVCRDLCTDELETGRRGAFSFGLNGSPILNPIFNMSFLQN